MLIKAEFWTMKSILSFCIISDSSTESNHFFYVEWFSVTKNLKELGILLWIIITRSVRNIPKCLLIWLASTQMIREYDLPPKTVQLLLLNELQVTSFWTYLLLIHWFWQTTVLRNRINCSAGAWSNLNVVVLYVCVEFFFSLLQPKVQIHKQSSKLCLFIRRKMYLMWMWNRHRKNKPIQNIFMVNSMSYLTLS